MPSHQTIAAPLRYEIEKIKGSRFIADLEPAASEEEAMAAIERILAEFSDASHHCWAWRLDHDDAFRYSDDGEPTGSAGRPMLNQILGSGLSYVVIIVTRYFGGTKLGTGGLVRAYGAAARAALDAAEVVTVEAKTTLEFRFPYEMQGPIQGLLVARELEPASTEFGVDVVMTVQLRVEDAPEFSAALHELTAGRIEARTV